MPQYQISSYPVDAFTINGVMYQPGTQQLTLNDRYSRIFTRTATNTQTSYNGFVNVPGFNSQFGTSVSWNIGSFEGVSFPLSTNMSSLIQNGDPFTVTVGTTVNWGTNSPVTHHGFVRGVAQSHTLTNGGGSKRWHTTSSYNGNDTVNITGFYCCAGTSSLFGTMSILALRFGVNMTGYATGDGNQNSGGQTGLTNSTYISNWPQNTSLNNFTFINYPPPPEPTPMGS